MKLLLLIAAGMSLATGSSTSSTDRECSRSAALNVQSMLANLLQVAGYSDICVASALDYCSSAQEGGHFASLMEEVRDVVQQASLLVNKWDSRPRHCKDLLDSGDSGSGLRQVYPYPGQPHHRVTVYCDHTVDGGGWTIFQRRSNDTVRQDFYRTWVDYQLGFGDLEGEFWLGLDLLHQLSSASLQQLRVDLDDYEGGHLWAQYESFHVGAPDTKYRLSIGRFSGDAGNSLASHHKMKFSTYDADHDTYNGNCAAIHRGAWWYSDCDDSNLNGYQHVGQYSSYENEGITWQHWRGDFYSLRRTSMMIRPAF